MFLAAAVCAVAFAALNSVRTMRIRHGGDESHLKDELIDAFINAAIDRLIDALRDAAIDSE